MKSDSAKSQKTGKIFNILPLNHECFAHKDSNETHNFLMHWSYKSLESVTEIFDDTNAAVFVSDTNGYWVKLHFEDNFNGYSFDMYLGEFFKIYC